MTAFRVLLAEDHTLVRAGIRALVEAMDGALVVAEADNGREAVAAAKAHRPDIIVMDISMKDLNGIEATARIRGEWPQARVLILSMHDTGDFVRRALEAGASGYLVKDSAPAELALAIEALLRGEAYLSPRISRHLLPGAGGNGGAGALEALTPRQREILQLIAEGNSTKQIAFSLEVSVKTVETHRAALMDRLGIRDVAGLALFAARHRLVELDTPPQ